jgi:GT2 family glycosyltransferase
MSRKGALLSLSTLVAIVSIAADGWAADVLAIVAVLGFSAVILLISIRLSEALARVSEVQRDRPLAFTQASAPMEMADDHISAIRMTTAIELLESAAETLDEADKPYSKSLPEMPVDTPVVTVVVPCFNEDRFVSETLRSVLGQSFTRWECVVVDDASTDNSLEQIWSVARQDERFRVLRHRLNSGLSAARNTGLRAAQGRFVTFLDADDLLMRESLMDRVITLSNALGDPHVIGAYSGVRIAPEEITFEELPSRMETGPETIIDFVSADSECPFNAHAPLIRTDTARALGGFNERMHFGGEDWDLWYRAMRNGYAFVPTKSITAIYRQKRHSMVRRMADGHVSEADRLIEAAHVSVEPSIMLAPSPTPLPESIGTYQALIHRADRAIRFAAMALVAGDDDGASRALNVITEVPLPLIERHLDITNLANRGMQRALAISPKELNSVRALSKPLRQHLEQTIRSLAPKPPPIERANHRPFVEALIIPQWPGDVAAMIETAGREGIETGSIGLLDISTETGPLGPNNEGGFLPRWSFNEWVLQSGSTETLVVPEVRIGIVEQFVQAHLGLGGRVLVHAPSGSSLMNLADSHRGSNRQGQPSKPPLTKKSFIGAPDTIDFSDPGEPTSTWRLEEYPGTKFDPLKLMSFKDAHRGERVVIIGNGPSLNRLDLSRLKNENTIAVNAIFYASEQMGFDPTFYVVEDTAVVKDNLNAIIEYDAGQKFFPSIYRNLIGEHDNVAYFMMNRGFYEYRSPDFCIPRFSFDPSQTVYSGQSVTLINLQLAHYLGFEEVVLVGMDFSYSIPADAIVEGDVITSVGQDPNHFHPDYFGPGKVWKDPKLDRVLANYALAKQIFESTGRRIINATAGGKLELFDRVSYEELFG